MHLGYGWILNTCRKERRTARDDRREILLAYWILSVYVKVVTNQYSCRKSELGTPVMTANTETVCQHLMQRDCRKLED